MMEPQSLNATLLHQISETLGDQVDFSPQFQALLKRVGETYNKLEEDYRWVEAEVDYKDQQLIGSASNAYSFFDSLRMGFIMCDVSPQIVVTNQTIQKIFSSKLQRDPAKPDEKIDWSLEVIDKLLQPELNLTQLVRGCLASNQPFERKEVKFGTYILRLFIAPVVSKTEKAGYQNIGVVVLAEDITEQKVLERSRDEFFSIASHELRTPLTAIRGNASLIKQYYGPGLPDKDLVEMLDDIHESSVRLIGIVNDFLDVSAIEQGKIEVRPEKFYLKEVIIDVMREVQSLCSSKGISLVADPSLDVGSAVVADKQRIKQVVYNLVGNAVKFTDKGSITISSSRRENSVNIIIADTGSGMSAESQRLLFRKFQQASDDPLTRDSSRGTGLGLYISKLIVELSGGMIWLEGSTPGKGSTFVFSLPCAEVTESKKGENVTH